MKKDQLHLFAYVGLSYHNLCVCTPSLWLQVVSKTIRHFGLLHLLDSRKSYGIECILHLLDDFLTIEKPTTNARVTFLSMIRTPIPLTGHLTVIE